MKTLWQVPVIKTYELTQGQAFAVEFMLQKGGYIAAIKYIRHEFEAGLKEAKDLVDMMRDQA